MGVLDNYDESVSVLPDVKVFALLGLSYDSAIYLAVPNYRQSDEEICIGMVLSVITATSSLDFVVMLGSGYGDTFGLPSWCPY